MRRLVSLLLVFLLSACSFPAPGSANSPATASPIPPNPITVTTNPVPLNSVSATSSASQASGPLQFSLVNGSTQKVCQLTGDKDWETNQPTAAKTFTNFGLDAVDLGYPVEMGNKLILLFGDSWPSTHPQTSTPAQSEVPPDDSVGFTTRTTPPDSQSCLDLVINHNSAGKFIPPTIVGPVKVNQGYFNVPSGGVDVAGKLFAFFWTNHCTDPVVLSPAPLHPLAFPAPGACPETIARSSLGRGVLAQSGDGGLTFSQVVTLPAGFVYATAVNTNLQADIPAGQRLGILIFGVPRYRASIPYLAYAPAQTFSDPATWRFFSGLDAGGRPRWVDSPAWQQGAASPAAWTPPGRPEIFNAQSDADRCIGEFSITWNTVLDRWLLVYGCHGEVDARVAPAPWGPWSVPVSLLNVNSATACRLVMVPAGCPNQRDFWPQDHPNGKFQAGGFYAPFVLNRYTSAEPGDAAVRKATIYWLVSPWNPYEVQVLRSTLQLGPSS